MSSYNLKAKNKETDDIVEVTAIDNYYGGHRYGYRINGHTLREDVFRQNYKELTND